MRGHMVLRVGRGPVSSNLGSPQADDWGIIYPIRVDVVDPQVEIRLRCSSSGANRVCGSRWEPASILSGA